MGLDELSAEYRGALLGDKRRSARLERLAQQMAERPDASFPEALDEGQLEGAYRFLTNDAVSVDALLAPHVRETVGRIQKRTALAVHDTTTLSFRVDGKRTGFDEASKTKTQQFWTHATLAVAADGSRQPYGVLHLSHATTIQHARWRAHVERVAPLGLDLVHVMDREADDFALFHALLEARERFVIRLQFDRQVTPARCRDPRCLTDVLEASLLEGAPTITRDVTLGARAERDCDKKRKTHPARQGRTATLTMAGVRVGLPPPKDRVKHLPHAIELTFIHVWESNPPANEAAVEWKLITTEPPDLEAIERVVDWYRARWTVEEFFKALKTGCAVEKRQLESFAGLSKAVTFFAPMAWHLLLLRHQARYAPDTPADQVISKSQLAALRAVARRPLPTNPTAKEVMLAIAALGGHLRRNGEPGWITLHRGYEKLLLVALGWDARSDQS